MIKKKPKAGLTKFLTKSLNNFTANKEDSNLFATQLFSKKEMLHFISAQLAYGTQIPMDLSLSNMKTTNYIASFVCSVLLHKFFVRKIQFNYLINKHHLKNFFVIFIFFFLFYTYLINITFFPGLVVNSKLVKKNFHKNSVTNLIS